MKLALLLALVSAGCARSGLCLYGEWTDDGVHVNGLTIDVEATDPQGSILCDVGEADAP